MSELLHENCKELPSGSAPLSDHEITQLNQQIPYWVVGNDRKSIQREFRFKNYYETMAFVNAVAWIAHQEDHHPDITVSYNRCHITYSTHSVGGLSRNDFICAAKIDNL